MMTEKEFIQAVLFKPWVNRANSLDEMDCYGLLDLYYEHVHGVSLPIIDGYKDDYAFERLWRKEVEKTWRQCGSFEVGAAVTFYDASMKPVHVGICVDGGKVLHARGTIDKGGKVEMHSISTLTNAFHAVTFHTLVN